ncbi:MAG: hypothetical protein ACQERZ_03940 [Fusobacteriota bacterium]
MGRFIIPLGIATLTFLIITIVLGMFPIIKPRWRVKVHKITGIITLILALLHAGIVVYLYL